MNPDVTLSYLERKALGKLLCHDVRRVPTRLTGVFLVFFPPQVTFAFQTWALQCTYQRARQSKGV